MVRFIVLIILLTLLPTFVYAAFRRLTDGRSLDQILNEAPLVPLFVVGVVLAGLALLALAYVSGNVTGHATP